MEQALKIAVILAATDRMTRVVENAVNNSSKHLDKFSKSARAADTLASVGAKATMAGAAMTGFFATTVDAALESEAATRKLENVFKTMGDKTGIAAQKAAEYAGALQMTIGIEDEQIMAVQAKLATFKKASDAYAIQSGMFNRLTAAAFDLEAMGFGDAMSNITQLGKAFQDPIKGATALKRSGTLTAAEVAKVGQIAKRQGVRAAQEFMVQAIERQAKGAAAATSNPLKKLSIQYGEISESIGRTLLPALKSFSDWLSNIMPKIQGWIERNPGLVKAIAGFGAALAVLGPIFLVAASAVVVFNSALWANPITWIAAAIIAAAAAIMYYWEDIKKFFSGLWDAVKAAWNKFWNWVSEMIQNYTPYGLIYKHWDTIVQYFSALWEKVKGFFSGFWEWAKNLFLNYTPVGLVIKHWDGIVEFFGNLWENVKKKFWEFIDWIFGWAKQLWDAGANIVNNIWEGIKGAFGKLVEWWEDSWKSVREYLPFSPAKRGPLKDIHRVKIVETIAESIKPTKLTDKIGKVMQATKATIDGSVNFNNMSGIVGRVANKIAPAPAPMALATATTNNNNRQNVVVNFQPTFNSAGIPGQKQDFVSQLKEYESELMRMIKDATARNERKKF